MNEKPDFVKRLEEEHARIEQDLIKLSEFLETPQFANASDKQQLLLVMQANTMTTLLGILGLRLDDLGY